VGFQLSDYVPILEDCYHIGKDIVCHNGINEAEKLISYNLKYEKGRENIKSVGLENAKIEHRSIKGIECFMIEIEKVYDKKR
jgi:spore maturation protein CgeB